MTTGAFALLSASLASVQVSGGSTCPTPADVAAHLATLAPASVEGEPTHRARVEPSPQGVLLVLSDLPGNVLGEKRIEGAAACAELAAASAVVLATWWADAGEPPTVARGRAEERAAPKAPPSPARRDDRGLELAAGLTGSLADGNFGLGLTVLAGLTPGRKGLGGDVQITALGAHTMPLQGSTVSWQRFAFAVGPHYRLPAGALRVDLLAQLAAGLLTLSWEGNWPYSWTDLDPGAALGLRVSVPGGLWLGVFGTYFLRGRRLEPAAGPAFEVPKFEGLLALGLRFGPD